MKGAVRNIAGGVATLAFLFIPLFAPARTFRFWQGSVYLAVCSVAFATIYTYLQRSDPELLRRRMRGPAAEREISQKLTQLVAPLLFVSVIALSSLGQRTPSSQVPFYATIAGFGLVVLGFFVMYRALRENTFAAANIDVEAGQTVIATGPYALVRHPYYTGLLAWFAGSPLALGSWWGLALFVPLALVLAWRIRFEERFLAQHLPGYADYRRSVRFRLVPMVW
jgi:protein-S-isoprenylcysteine O-methyltransferase Ste14